MSEERVAVDAADAAPEDADEDEGVVLNWFVSEGTHVAAGEAVCEFQVEKVSIDVPAPVDGTLDEIALAEDAVVDLDDTLGWIRPD